MYRSFLKNLASKKSCLATAFALIICICSIHILSMQDAQPLLNAAERGDNEEVAALLKSIENPDQRTRFVMTRNADKRTSLHLAALNNDETMLSMLLNTIPKPKEQAEFIKMRDLYGFQALYLAIRDKNVKAARTLVDFYKTLGLNIPFVISLRDLGINIPEQPSCKEDRYLEESRQKKCTEHKKGDFDVSAFVRRHLGEMKPFPELDPRINQIDKERHDIYKLPFTIYEDPRIRKLKYLKSQAEKLLAQLGVELQQAGQIGDHARFEQLKHSCEMLAHRISTMHEEIRTMVSNIYDPT